MFKKTLIAAAAALTVAGSTAAMTNSAQAGWRGAAIAAGVAGLAIGGAVAANNAYGYGPSYGYRSAYGYRSVNYGYGCGYVSRPYYNSWGQFLGYRSVPAC